MNIRRPMPHNVPGLNTASLPDLIFTVLFFFMIVTHMRQTTLKVAYDTPQGTQLTRLVKKSAVVHIYVGPPAASATHADRRTATLIQVNDRVAQPDEVADLVAAERTAMNPEDAARMTVSIKADRRTPMHIITTLKLALRQAGATRISYSATQPDNHSR